MMPCPGLHLRTAEPNLSGACRELHVSPPLAAWTVSGTRVGTQFRTSGGPIGSLCPERLTPGG